MKISNYIGLIGTAVAICLSLLISLLHRPEALPELDTFLIWVLPPVIAGLLWTLQTIMVARKLKSIQNDMQALRKKFDLECQAIPLILFLLVQEVFTLEGGELLLWLLPSIITLFAWTTQIVLNARKTNKLQSDMRTLREELEQ